MNPAAKQDITLVIAGGGGAGALTAGELLLKAAARRGYFGLMTRAVGPQIRGGESAALLRISRAPVAAHRDMFDVLFAIDWTNYARFTGEIALAPGARVFAGADDMPQEVAAARPLPEHFDFRALLARDERPNMFTLGFLAALIGIEADIVAAVIAERFAHLGREVRARNIRAAATGAAQAARFDPLLRPPAARAPQERWLISGNQAAALGALAAGVRFAAAYPITPSSDLTEWLGPRIEALGGQLVQAEDELASINMLIGASFGGVPALSATSGPGLALMMEGIGLAVMTETPLVVIDVQRAGPSTGIPTRSEQTDLEIALYGLHGEAPHLVLAPMSVPDCLFTTAWAVELAERLQTPAIVLSEQRIGQMNMILDAPALPDMTAQRKLAQPAGDDPCLRYAATADHVAPMAIPGTAGGMHTPTGLEHDARGRPSSQPADHLAQLRRRQEKLAAFDYGDHWAHMEGEGAMALIGWGGAAAPVLEAARQCRAMGVEVRTIIPRLLAPAQPDRMAAALAGVERVLVVENSHSGQFLRYLRAHYDLPGEVRSLRHAGPAGIAAGEVRAAIADLLHIDDLKQPEAVS
ncbi:MAG TPA: 2-oxoacid:acceptor oxidoreductase subunit alpha [Thermopetrobacter sp.]|nr:2-oxoacid:acceptor oxidoreductase subunit alpha [Thermopetrobacter sp.]